MSQWAAQPREIPAASGGRAGQGRVAPCSALIRPAVRWLTVALAWNQAD